MVCKSSVQQSALYTSNVRENITAESTTTNQKNYLFKQVQIVFN